MKVTDVRRIAVVGAGTMGHGIGQEFALDGCNVVFHHPGACGRPGCPIVNGPTS